jgi:hypothetical protein
MYLIDSDVLITAKNSYYAFDLCPGFWTSLLDKHQSGQVHSLDRIRMELQQGRDDDDLVKWVNDTVPPNFFLSTHQADVAAAYTEVMLWVQRSTAWRRERDDLLTSLNELENYQ